MQKLYEIELFKEDCKRKAKNRKKWQRLKITSFANQSISVILARHKSVDFNLGSFRILTHRHLICNLSARGSKGPSLRLMDHHEYPNRRKRGYPSTRTWTLSIIIFGILMFALVPPCILLNDIKPIHFVGVINFLKLFQC